MGFAGRADSFRAKKRGRMRQWIDDLGVGTRVMLMVVVVLIATALIMWL